MPETDAERADRFQRERDVAIDQRDRALAAASAAKEQRNNDLTRLRGLLSRALDFVNGCKTPTPHDGAPELQQAILDEFEQ